MPYMDDWSLSSDLLVRWRTGTLAARDFWAQHNESRPFFPRLVFLLIGTVTHGDLRPQLWVNLTLALVVSAGVFRLARETTTVRPATLWALGTLANLLVFTPKQ